MKDQPFLGFGMLRGSFIAGSLLALSFALWACNDGPQIASPGSEAPKGSNRPDDDDEGDLVADDDDFDDDGQLKEGGVGELASGADAKPIDYPVLDLHGSGSLSCDGERYSTLSKYKVNIDADKLVIDFYLGKVTSGGSNVEDKANPKIAEKLGPNNYERIPKDERTQLIKDGFQWAPYVIFAKSAFKAKTNETFTFDKAFPIFPLPAGGTSYDKLEGSPKSWSTKVTGGPTGSFNATMTIELISRADEEVTLKMSLTIAEDTDRSLYEAFPVAREATYTVNVKTKDVRRAHVVNWYRGDSQCDGKPEDITQDYNLCTKTVKDKTETFTCL